jgi:hypothetical protein
VKRYADPQWQTPSWHVDPAPQGVPHPPQFIASVETSTQDEPQQTPTVDDAVRQAWLAVLALHVLVTQNDA